MAKLNVAANTLENCYKCGFGSLHKGDVMFGLNYLNMFNLR